MVPLFAGVAIRGVSLLLPAAANRVPAADVGTPPMRRCSTRAAHAPCDRLATAG
jgi:hypothetical protein